MTLHWSTGGAGALGGPGWVEDYSGAESTVGGLGPWPVPDGAQHLIFWLHAADTLDCVGVLRVDLHILTARWEPEGRPPTGSDWWPAALPKAIYRIGRCHARAGAGHFEGMGTSDGTELEAAFSCCWREDMPRVLRYAQRHVGPHDALDVTAEVFTVAWRRWSEVPEPALPWLIGVARRVAANRRRTLLRGRRLQSQLQLLQEITRDNVAPVDPTDKLEALRRLTELSEVEREAVLLVAWDGLSSVEAAHVLGLNPATFRKRLSRARVALQADHADTALPQHPLTLETP